MQVLVAHDLPPLLLMGRLQDPHHLLPELNLLQLLLQVLVLQVLVLQVLVLQVLVLQVLVLQVLVLQVLVAHDLPPLTSRLQVLLNPRLQLLTLP